MPSLRIGPVSEPLSQVARHRGLIDLYQCPGRAASVDESARLNRLTSVLLGAATYPLTPSVEVAAIPPVRVCRVVERGGG